MAHHRSRYIPGTLVQRKDGAHYIKTPKGMKPLARHVWEEHHAHPLQEGQRVFHVNGNRQDNKPQNLVAIKFNTTRYAFEWKILYVPKAERLRIAA